MKFLNQKNKMITKKQQYHKHYYQSHKEKIKERSALRYIKHKDKINARMRAYGKTEHGRIVKLASKFGCSYEEAKYWINIKHCQICNDNFAVATDHDHETGYIRGRLCYRCNRAIGALGDTVKLLRKAVIYLENAEKIEHSGNASRDAQEANKREERKIKWK